MKSFLNLLYPFFKRFFDITVSFIGCIVLLPLLFFVKIVYLFYGDYAPTLYRQERVGKNGKKIRIFKIRSMVPKADELLKELLKNPKYKQEWERNQKLEDDPRITRFGRFLRKTSLDEVPQFINVLIGDMSVIGPRPLLENELEEHGGSPELYQSVRPGITGWWAANGRSAVSYEQRLELEYYYIENRSLWLDIKCVFKTVITVLKKEGAQ